MDAGTARRLAGLVAEGIKTATSSAYPLYALEGEPLPRAGTYHVILNAADEAVCIVRIKRVSVVPFDEVSEAFAYKEGEGDRSLRYWRSAHEVFFAQCLQGTGIRFSRDMKVVCEEFEVAFRP